MPNVVRALTCGAVTIALTAGCSSGQQNWPSTASARTTPATSTAHVSANGGPLARMRVADPCGLLDSGTLATLGTPVQGESQFTAQPGSGLDICGTDMLDRTGTQMSITLTLGAQAEIAEHSPNRTIPGLPPVAEIRTGGICGELVALQVNPPAGVDVSVTDANDPCTPAIALAKNVIARLQNPPQRANPPGSLAELDPCTTLDLSTATAVLGSPARDGSLVSMYNCAWASSTDPGPTLGVTFTLGSDPKTDNSRKPVQVAGITAYQTIAPDAATPQCDIRWATRMDAHSTEPEPYGDQIVDVGFGDPGTTTAVACAKAAMAAAAVVGSLPKT